MNESVRLDIQDGIADVRLSRPEQHNALDLDMFDRIAEVITDLENQAGLRAVVLSGDGPSFCAGLDIASFAAGREMVDRLLERRTDGLNLAQQVCVGWRRLPVPVIASLHGAVYGGGAQIALGADIRMLAADARLSIMEVRWGLVPDMGLSVTLRDLVSMDVAKELCFTGRIVEAGEAVRLGLAAGIAEDPHAAALEMAGVIAGKSPHAIRAAKRLLEQTWHEEPQPALELETALQLELLFSPNQIEAVRANLEKRVPDFADAD